MKKKDFVITATTTLFLAVLSVSAWFKPADEFSLSERRKLKQFSEVTFETVISGRFMKNFEDYTLDQFPMRDHFRTVKALTALHIFGQKENNEIYVADGYAAKIEYPLKEDTLKRAAKRFEYVYETYLKHTDTANYLAVIPDKNYFLADGQGMLSLDYEKLYSLIRSNTEFLEYIDITNLLSIEDYYKTDTHWRQEQITDVAEQIGEAMGVDVSAEYVKKTLEQDFFGVYYGQSALPLEGEALHYLTNDLLEECLVYDHENDREISVYDMKKAGEKDPYELFLSGSLSLITIENEQADSEKELVVFRDSFGSALAPLLVPGYRKITLVDIRYMHPDILKKYVEFDNQDVLFLYSTGVLNNSETIK